MPAVKASVVYYGSPIMSNERPDNPIVEVEQVHAPILGFFGEVDRGIPVQDVQHYQEVARKAGKEVDFTIYPGLGHAFFTFAADEPGSAASQESWAKAVLFLRARLGQGE
ncbi:hypothetical protein EPA93_00475 [Ktedonosporobacter rubrisoli]|uniref:Dienelactone hydrolase domain-containing protein n=1 Tax=Ktedonosporobacter rubrisoli TaxID=2509675 RepID=A0A4P6JIR7_KTERU|nr:dienelactone hydrolase family protein [Ktedonosporobacter rubrisoli]QBD74546.1 hypothetical protein EPA93_00475 [Ktedonosporobacter rubrisoli]